jgi:hypothetical protein
MKQNWTIPLEVKSLTARQIEGYGSVFGNVDLGGDVIARGAFLNSLEEHAAAGSMPAMFWMHDMKQVPGRWDEMAEDSNGLVVNGTLADTGLGNEMRTLLKMKAVRGLSIGFYIRDADYKEDGVRVIKSVELIETSLVSLAMNPLAQITQAKSRLSAAGEYVPTAREWEHRLRDVGLSSKTAKRVVAVTNAKPGRDAFGVENEAIAELCELMRHSTEQTQIDTIRNLTRA